VYQAILPALVGVLVLALGLPAYFRGLKAIPVVLFGVIIPLALFGLSAGMLPDWKGACRCGWVDGFLIGKFALSPIVLFATVALCRYELALTPAGRRPERWVRWGLFSGAVTSVLCLNYGFLCMDVRALKVWLILACYVPLWYVGRAVYAEAKFPVAPWDYLWNTLGMVPFWVASWYWSHRVFEGLPDVEPQRCFIVTAAALGHCPLVGPFVEIDHGPGRRRCRANRQLIAFWRAEEIWCGRAPASHRLFRRCYNCVGPRIAARIRSPWVADLVFIALKPAEWLVRVMLLVRVGSDKTARFAGRSLTVAVRKRGETAR